MQEVVLFESVAEYVESVVLANSALHTKLSAPVIVREFDLKKIFDNKQFDPITFFEEYTIDGKNYTRVKWGDDDDREEINLIHDKTFGKHYSIYQKVGKDHNDANLNIYICLIAEFFESYEAAETEYFRRYPPMLLRA